MTIVRKKCPTKFNCSTCLHGFQWGYASNLGSGTFNCNLDNHQEESWLFVSCKNWIKRNIKNAKMFEGAFYMGAGEKYMDNQWREIGKEHRWL